MSRSITASCAQVMVCPLYFLTHRMSALSSSGPTICHTLSWMLCDPPPHKHCRACMAWPQYGGLCLAPSTRNSVHHPKRAICNRSPLKIADCFFFCPVNSHVTGMFQPSNTVVGRYSWVLVHWTERSGFWKQMAFGISGDAKNEMKGVALAATKFLLDLFQFVNCCSL